ncbi:MAG: hypothetical protein ACOYM3_17790 [Terrimicrobiaceae bacterium]
MNPKDRGAISGRKLAGARVILSGDVRQHGAITFSDSLRCILRYGSPHVAELSGEGAIQRQQVKEYRQAVVAAERGDTGDLASDLTLAPRPVLPERERLSPD